MTTPAGQDRQQNRRRIIEQERGERAWRDVNEAKGLGEKQKEYRSLARGLNAMIQINGLGQALAFLKAKGKGEQPGQPVQNAHGLLFTHLSNWVGAQMGYQGTNLLEWIVAPTTSREAYRRATAECLAFGNWLRRFAEAELKGE